MLDVLRSSAIVEPNHFAALSIQRVDEGTHKGPDAGGEIKPTITNNWATARWPGRGQSSIADDMLRLRSRSFHPRIIGAGSARFSRMDVPSPKLIVNCTSAGMTPNEDTSPWPADAPFPADAILYDLVYKPSATKLMADAAGAGLRVIGGIGMLAEQAAAAFELWTGVSSVRVSGMMRKVIDGGRETEDEN